MRCNAGIIAPDFLQQRFAGNRMLAGTIKIAQDGRLLFGEANLAALWIEQKLRARPERIGSNGEYGVFAGFMLAQLGAHPCQQHGKAKRLCHVVIGAGF